MESILDVLSVSSERGCDAQEVCCGERGCWNVKHGRLIVGPDSCSLRAINILNYLVLDIVEHMTAVFVELLANFCSNFDEECVFLGLVNKRPCKLRRSLTSSPSEDHLANTALISSYCIPRFLFIIAQASLIALIIPLLW